jgi:plasmid stability protein
MSHLLIRDLDVGTIERLKLRAQRHGRSLQEEVKAILQAAATRSMSEAHSAAEQWQRKLTRRNTPGQAGAMYRDSVSSQ